MPATFSLLFKRNFAIEKQLWRRSLVELIIILIILICVSVKPITRSKKLIYSTQEYKEQNSDVTSNLEDITILKQLVDPKRPKTKYSLTFTPITEFTVQITDYLSQKLSLNGSFGFRSGKELEDEFDSRTMLAGIEFHDLTGDKVPQRLSVSIRFPSEFRTIHSFLTEDRLWMTRCSGIIDEKSDNIQDKHKLQDIYIREGFLTIQHQLFLQWYHLITRDLTPATYPEPHVTMHNIRLKTASDYCTYSSESTSEFLLNILYILPFLNVLRLIAGQLEDNVYTHQWYNGYPFLKQWLNAFLVIFLRLFIIAILVAIFVYIYWSMGIEDATWDAFILLLLFLMLYTMELIITAFVFAKWFVDYRNAMIFGAVMWTFNYALFGLPLKTYWDSRGYYILPIMIIFFNNQMAFSLQVFRLTCQIPDSVHAQEIGMLFGAAILSIILYTALLIFSQFRSPGRLLSRNVLMKRYKRKEEQQPEDKMSLHFGRARSWHKFEFGDVGSIEMMRLRNVSTKHSTTERKILKNISLRLYENEILVILGHIGAGKVTLLRVMAGLKIASRGTITLNGENILNAPRKYREVVDFRCDDNGLVGHLSVLQTIQYFVKLKLPKDEFDRFHMETRKWLEYLDPHIPSRTTLIRKLKAGKRRLVSLCCALAANTKVVILDDPTSPLNGAETQAYYSILMREKEGRTIVVMTYRVDEAERLGDRIGILSTGVLEACGTQFFLRAKFANHLEMVLIKKPNVPENPITLFLQQFISHIEPENEIGDSLTYKIGFDQRPKLQRMLLHLESERENLGIDSIRVVACDISDIFMKLVTSFRIQQQVIPDVTQVFKYSVVSQKQLRKQQIRAMFYKKLIHTAPNVWPVIVILASLVLVVLIARITILLGSPLGYRYRIPIGIEGNENLRTIIPDIGKCGHIEIVSVSKAVIYNQANAVLRTFEKDSFDCKESSYMMELQKSNQLNCLGAVDVGTDQLFNAYITQQVFHSAPMTLNLLHNAILNKAFPNKPQIVYVINNNPMPTKLSMKVNLLVNEVTHLSAPLTFGCVLPLTVSVFIVPLVEEHIFQLRTLQVISGIALQIYWSVNLFYDLFTFFIYCIIILIITAAAGIGNFGAYENLLVLLMLVFYGLASLPLTYLLSMFVNRSMMRSFLLSILIQGLTGLVLYVFYWEVANSNHIFFYCGLLSPGFAVLDGISTVYTQCLEKSLCEQKCSAIRECNLENMADLVPHCRFETLFQWAAPGILPVLTFMTLIACIALFLIFWVELHRFEKKFHSSKDLHNMRTACYPFDDADVAEVKVKIAEADMNKCKQSVFLVDQVEAVMPRYGNKIHTVSFALNKYMCMGIYGVQNCGKSHLLRQLVGIDGFAFGEIYVRGLDFKYDLQKIQTYVGYCPQSYALIDELTPREHIRLLAMIRGVPESKIGEKIADLTAMLNMNGYMHRKCGHLTPEKQRKVSVALSLVAYNKVFVLDEPTRGMPATTRREIWNILRYIRFCGKTIIFATADEIECKVLADFIILFQNSEMIAIGSMQYLRFKYSHGFYLEVRLSRDGTTAQEAEANLRRDVDNLSRFVSFMHEKSEMIGRLHNWFKFYVPVSEIVYSSLYGTMEKNKVRLNILDYAIYQASLYGIVNQVQESRANLKFNHPESNNIDAAPQRFDSSLTAKMRKSHF